MTSDDDRSLVRALLAQIDQRGKDSPDAALALLDLLERERISQNPSAYHGPDLTDMIRRMHGAHAANTRLSPRAIEDAVLGLIAHVDQSGLPARAVIRAMACSVDPRVTPALVALLERIIDDPEQDDLAGQVADALVIFAAGDDDVAMRGMRIAESRGRGRAKVAADHVLRGSPDSAGDLAALPVRTARAVIAIDGAITRLQRRPGHHEVIIDAADGLLLIDPDRPEATRRIALAPEFLCAARTGSAAWCLSADGDAAVVFADGSPIASRVSLRDGTATAIALPPPHAGESSEHLRYVWTDPDRLIAIWSLATVLRELRGDATAFTIPVSVYIRRDFRAWFGALDKLSPRTSHVMRTEPAEARILAYDYATTPGEFIALAWTDDARTIRVRAPGSIHQLACDGDRLYLMRRREVHAVDRGGAVVARFAAPAGMSLLGLDTLPATAESPPVLVVAAAPLTAPAAPSLLVFGLGE